MSEHPGVRIGEEYPVLEVLAAQHRTLFRLPDRSARRDEIESPGLWDAAKFEVVSGRMPTCWVAGLNDGRLTLAPQESQRPGFWEDFFDHLQAGQADGRFRGNVRPVHALT
ncbi:hypothetical protein OG372_00060 [Streptomyces sp. NBC_01020]|uniref:hypothetical protein n=1 Tax=unclassified Streptomyces TaxID=2593676 RepID=UPI002E23C01F|nr:hypothetical protein OG372_00060 [Streptomyces sp. NBC_01020]